MLAETPLYYALADFVIAVSESKPPACTMAAGARGTIIGIRVNEAIIRGGTLTIDN
jgi:hypothetical protein